MANRTVVATGATGRQGGATLRALEGKGFTLKAVTRNPTAMARKLSPLAAEAWARTLS